MSTPVVALIFLASAVGCWYLAKTKWPYLVPISNGRGSLACLLFLIAFFALATIVRRVKG